MLHIGTVDVRQHCHLVATCIATVESGLTFGYAFNAVGAYSQEMWGRIPNVRYVVSDAAASLGNAAVEVWGDGVAFVCCYAHLHRSLSESSGNLARVFCDEGVRAEVEVLVGELASLGHEDVFLSGLQLLNVFMHAKGESAAAEQMWRVYGPDASFRWSQATVPSGVPTTNNALEGNANQVWKRCVLSKRRHSVLAVAHWHAMPFLQSESMKDCKELGFSLDPLIIDRDWEVAQDLLRDGDIFLVFFEVREGSGECAWFPNPQLRRPLIKAAREHVDRARTSEQQVLATITNRQTRETQRQDMEQRMQRELKLKVESQRAHLSNHLDAAKRLRAGPAARAHDLLLEGHGESGAIRVFLDEAQSFNCLVRLDGASRECSEHVKWSCDCKQFKHYMKCQHALAVGVYKGCITVPTRNDTTRIMPYVAPGRPCNHGGARDMQIIG